MAYRYGERQQMDLLPPCIDNYVSDDDPVRAYDAFVDALDFDELGISINPDKVGCPGYDPRAMLKLLIYGYSYGIRSSRKLERATHHNLSFVWLMGGLKPDHKTIAEFRRNNKKELKGVLKQCAHLCVKLDLIAGNVLFIDGTKIRANASIKNSWTRERCEKALKNIDKRIESILAECEAIDEREMHQGSMVKMDRDLQDSKKLRSKVETILSGLKKEGINSLNTTDPDSLRVRSPHGSHAGYNVQTVVDEKHGLIVNSEVGEGNNDTKEFAEQVNQANKVLGKQCQIACADAGYDDIEELEKVDEQGITVIVPSRHQATKRKKGLSPFDKENFKYDAENDHFVCPEGKVLPYSYTNQKRKTRLYKVPGIYTCQKCHHFGVCTRSLRGRSVSRHLKEESRLRFEKLYSDPQNQEIYKLRQTKAEQPFGHIKRNLHFDSFLLRGREGVKAETAILSSCFNIVRLIGMFGVRGLIQTLS